MDAHGEWLELRVPVPPESVEPVSEVLARYGYRRGVVIEQAQRPVEGGVSLVPDPAGPVVVSTYVPRDHRAEETLLRIRTALDLLGRLIPVGPVEVTGIHEEDWAHAWREHYAVLHVGERLVIVPAWQEVQPREGEVVLILDPGLAFGTGMHPTTQLCLSALERYLQPDMTVLDLGTGSGILAIAAAKLGSGPVLGLDTDRVAVRAARRNVRRNRLAGQIQVEAGTLSLGRAPFELILANLLAHTLEEMADLLAGALAPGGWLIGSGVLQEQAGNVAAALQAAGLTLVEQLQQDAWVALVARR